MPPPFPTDSGLSKSQSLLSRDRESVWHPYTQHQGADPLLPVASAKGAVLTDTEGNTYLDMISSWWVNLHGHGCEAIADAIGAQARRLDHVHFAGVTHEPAVRLAESLLERTELGAGKVFLSDNGSTAVEVALKIAMQFWRNKGCPRSRILALEGGYHGDTVGAMSLGRSSGFFNAFESLLFSVETVSVPHAWIGHDPVSEEDRVLDGVRRMLAERGREFAALIVEPLVQGACGMRFHSERFLSALCALAHEFEIPVVFDEVMTGFYRLGTQFACLQTVFKPDMLCLSKGITGGVLPLGATVVRERFFEAFLGGSFTTALAHGHSYTANPITCAAALASLELIGAPGFQERVAAVSGWLSAGVERLGADRRIVKGRVRGTLAAFELGGEDAGYGAGGGRPLARFAQERGVIIRPLGNVVYLMPPYCVEEGQVARAFEVVSEWLARE